MRIIQLASGHLVICRGREGREQYFSFFVDRDSSSWSQWTTSARKFTKRSKAEADFAELRKRNRLRRQRRTRP